MMLPPQLSVSLRSGAQPFVLCWRKKLLLQEALPCHKANPWAIQTAKLIPVKLSQAVFQSAESTNMIEPSACTSTRPVYSLTFRLKTKRWRGRHSSGRTAMVTPLVPSLIMPWITQMPSNKTSGKTATAKATNFCRMKPKGIPPKLVSFYSSGGQKNGRFRKSPHWTACWQAGICSFTICWTIVTPPVQQAQRNGIGFIWCNDHPRQADPIPWGAT